MADFGELSRVALPLWVIRVFRGAKFPLLWFAACLTLALPRAQAALNDMVALRFNGLAPSEELGRAVAGLRDVNGDGVPDIAVGLVTAAQGEDGNAVSARIFSGADGALLWEIPRPANACAESINSVADAGDLNGDGRCEFMVGTPRVARAACGVGDDAGVVRVFNGATGALYSQRFGNDGDLLGWSVAGVGDVNGDGAPDLFMGAPGAGGGAGRVDVVANNATATLLASAAGDAAGDALGWSVAAAGLVNADGRADVVAGAPFAQGVAGSQGQGAGRAYVYAWPATGGFSRLYTLLGDGPYDALGYAVAGAGDINKDGRAEFVAGAPGGISAAGQVAAGDGYARLYAGLDGSVLRTWGGAGPGPGPHQAGDLLGYTLAALGDCDGQGQVEIAVGAPLTGNAHGAVYLFRPESDAPAAILPGDQAGDLLGIALAAGGDLWAGSAGRQEMLAGASGTMVQGHAGAGSAFVVACQPVPKPDIAVEPAEVNFGNVEPGTDVMRLVTLRNQGNAPLSIRSIGLAAGAPATLTLEPLPDLPLVLPPGAASAVATHFRPLTFGPAGARLLVSSDDPDESQVAVPLGGQGVAAQIEVIPAAVPFGEIYVGEWASAWVTIRNVGNLALEVNGVEIIAGGEVFSLFPPVAWVPAQRVAILQAAIQDGRFIFTIQTIDPPQAHRLEEAEDLGTQMWTPVPDVTFIQLPGQSIEAEFDLPEEPFRFYRVVDSAPPPEVSPDSMVVPFTLGPGEARVVRVVFTPGMAGDQSGTLAVDSTDPSQARIEVPLSGTGLMANLSPVAAIKAEAALPGSAPHAVKFLSGQSADPDGFIVDYAWDYGDGTGGAGPDPEHSFSPASYELLPGPAARYVTRLLVTDDRGRSDPTSVAVLVGPCPLRSRFFGTVGMMGLPLGDGTEIIARIGEEDVAFSRAQQHLGGTVYASEVPPIPRTGGCPLSREGQQVRFYVDGVEALEGGIWHHAWDQELNLRIPLHIDLDRGFDWLADGGDVRLIFEPASVTEVTIIDFVHLPTPSHPFEHFAGHAFGVTARRLDGTPVNHFDRPYRLAVAYTDFEWQNAGLPGEASLNLYYWDGARWQGMLPCAGCALDAAANVLTVELDHLTEFAFGLDEGLAPPVTVALGPAADALIASDTPTVNYGASTELQVGQLPSGGIARALLRFDLSSIPAGAKIESASVQVYLVQSSSAPATLGIELRRIDSAWQEATVAWATPLATTGAANVTGVGTVMNYYTWNVASLVQTWVNGNPNHGVALFSQTETLAGWRGFASREQTATPPRQPRLVVTYRP